MKILKFKNFITEKAQDIQESESKNDQQKNNVPKKEQKKPIEIPNWSTY